MEHSWIHPRDLPFSEEEFYRAFALIQGEEEARENARYLSSVVRQSYEQEAVMDLPPRAINHPTWAISDEGFALLGFVSDELRHRVERYMHNRWEAEREELIRNRLYRPSGSILAMPDQEVLDEVSQVLHEYAEEWRKTIERMRSRVNRRKERSR
jgi:hypothetical protein